MSEIAIDDSGAKALLDKMVAGKQLSVVDAKQLSRQHQHSVRTEEDVLRWLAGEYGLACTTLGEVGPDCQLLSLFPARILPKGELLPLRRLNGSGEVAPSR